MHTGGRSFRARLEIHDEFVSRFDDTTSLCGDDISACDGRAYQRPVAGTGTHLHINLTTCDAIHAVGEYDMPTGGRGLDTLCALEPEPAPAEAQLEPIRIQSGLAVAHLHATGEDCSLDHPLATARDPC